MGPQGWLGAPPIIRIVGGGVLMLEKSDNRRQRGNRLGGLEFQMGENGSTQGTSKDGSTRDPRAHRGKGRRVSTGMKFERFFTRPGDDGFRGVEWDLRIASISGEGGKLVFEQRDVEVPKAWSQTATNVVVQKYFRGQLGTPGRERSVRQLISRVADTITGWGKKDGYFADDESARVFNAELKHLLVQQKMSFNSPVWFNVGIEADPQC